MVIPHIREYYLDLGCGTYVVKAYSGKGIGVDGYPWEGVEQMVDDTSKFPDEDKKFDSFYHYCIKSHSK